MSYRISSQMKEWSRNNIRNQPTKHKIIKDKMMNAKPSYNQDTTTTHTQTTTMRRRKRPLFTPMKRDLLSDDEPCEELVQHMTLEPSSSSCKFMDFLSASKNKTSNNRITISKIKREIEGTKATFAESNAQKPATKGGMRRKRDQHYKQRKVLPLFSVHEDACIRTFLDGQRRMICKYGPSAWDMRGNRPLSTQPTMAQQRTTTQRIPAQTIHVRTSVLPKSNVQTLATEQDQLIQKLIDEQRAIMENIQRTSSVKGRMTAKAVPDMRYNHNDKHDCAYRQSFPGLGIGGISSPSTHTHAQNEGQQVPCKKCSTNLIESKSASIFYCAGCDLVLPMTEVRTA